MEAWDRIRHVEEHSKGLVVQGGRYYGAPLDPWSQHLTGTSESWETLVFDAAPDTNFGELPPVEFFDPDSTPDFSCSGQPMHFGFMVGNTYVEDPGYHGYDNWQITIVSGGPSSVEPSTWGRMKALYR
jgi:hypothetical protein